LRGFQAAKKRDSDGKPIDADAGIFTRREPKKVEVRSLMQFDSPTSRALKQFAEKIKEGLQNLLKAAFFSSRNSMLLPCFRPRQTINLLHFQSNQTRLVRCISRATIRRAVKTRENISVLIFPARIF
jgi:hypothetical protein